MVMKNKNQAEEDEELDLDTLKAIVQEEEERIQKDLGLYTALQSFDTTEAPANIRKAASTLTKFFESEGFSADDIEDDDSTKHPTRKSKFSTIVGALERTIKNGQTMDDPSEDAIATAIEAEAPAFVTAFSEALQTSGDISVKKAAVTKALNDLKSKVEARLAA